MSIPRLIEHWQHHQCSINLGMLFSQRFSKDLKANTSTLSVALLQILPCLESTTYSKTYIVLYETIFWWYKISLCLWQDWHSIFKKCQYFIKT